MKITRLEQQKQRQFRIRTKKTQQTWCKTEQNHLERLLYSGTYFELCWLDSRKDTGRRCAVWSWSGYGRSSSRTGFTIPTRTRRQVGDNRQMLPLDDNDRLADMIRRAVGGGLVDIDLEDVNRSPFAPIIRQARNSPDFKVSDYQRWRCMMGEEIPLFIWQGTWDTWKCWEHQRKSWRSAFLCIWWIYNTMVQTTRERLNWYMDGVDWEIYEAISGPHWDPRMWWL